MTARIRSTRSLFVAGLIAIVASTSLAAQEASSPSSEAPRVVADSAAAIPLGPTITSASLAVRSTEAALPTPPQAIEKHNWNKGGPQMIIGVAALLTGIVVGGTPGRVLTVGGAVTGLYGLYLYLQ